MTSYEEWIGVLDSGDESDAKPLIARALKAWSQLIGRDKETPTRVLQILDEQFQAPIDESSFPTLQAALQGFIGVDATYLLVWLSQPFVTSPEAAAARIDAALPNSSSDVTHGLRLVVGHYGTKLAQAYEIWNTIPNDWKTINQNVYVDQFTQKLLFRTKIITWSRGDFTIDSTPNSAMQLVQVLAKALRAVPSPDIYPAATLEPFLSELDEVRTFLVEDPNVGEPGHDDSLDDIPEREPAALPN